MTVPLYNYEEAIYSPNIETYTKEVAGLPIHAAVADRAIIPIVFPMTIHHVQVSFDVDALTLGDWALSDRALDLGVAASFQVTDWGPRLYTQLARTPSGFALNNTNHRISNKGLWTVPVSYPGTPDGVGWASQGRPIFIGRERGNQNRQGNAQRDTTPDSANAGLIVPPTNGAEQFIEVRAALRSVSGSLLNSSALGSYSAFPRGGIFVHIYGKSALTE